MGFFDETDDAWWRLFEVSVLSDVRLPPLSQINAGKKTGRLLFIASEAGFDEDRGFPKFVQTGRRHLT